MRVLQILPELNVGGVETGTVDFAKYLVQNGHHSVVVSNGGALVAELEKCGIRHYRLPVHKKSLWTVQRTIKALRKIIVDEKIDIVHARSRVPAWVAFFACRRTAARFITTCHGYYSTHYLSWVMGWGKLTIVPSEVIGRHMISGFKVPSENIRVIPRSVDLERFAVSREDQQGKSSYTVSIVGRITPIKGHVYFLRAMAKVVRSMPFVKIWVIGDAPSGKDSYKQELEVLIRRLGLTENVEFLGNRRDVPELLAETDVLVLSSIGPEAFGRVVLEAQAVGVPVVATKVGGVVEIIDDKVTGLMVLPKDTDGMAAAVMRLLSDKKYARELVVAARKKLETKFTLEHMASRTLEVYRELLESLNILVIKMSAVGDVILATASLKAIRRKYPKAKICCLVGKEARIVLQKCPYINELIVVDLQHKEKGFWGACKFSRRLREYRFDIVVDLQNNFKSHLWAFLSFARESYGYNNGKLGFLLTNTVKVPDNKLSPVAHQFQTLKMLGIPYREDAFLELWLSESDKKSAQQLLAAEWLAENSQVVGVNVSASDKWKTKNWPLEHIARLCDMLAGQNIRVVLTGMEKDREAARHLLTMAKSKPVNLVGKTDLMELAAVIKRCQVYVTPDSAPMHIAAAMRTPFIAFFGPTASQRHLPPARSFVVMERQLACAPCYSPTCKIMTHVCMREIMPDDVVRQVNRLMKENA